MAIRLRRPVVTPTLIVIALAGIAFIAVGAGCRRRAVPWNDATVRAALAPDSRAVFDLVATLQEPDRAGGTDWAKAAALCRGLAWPRCDRPALEELKRRSRPSGGDPAVATAALAVADATWAFGSEEAVRKMFRAELDRIPESDGPRRARVFLRFGIIDSNPDGQAALFAQACTADAKLCDRMKPAAEQEVRARFVPPGNVLPLYFGGAHPPIGRR